MKFLLQCILTLFLYLNVHAQVLNRGVSGNSTTQLLSRLDKDVIQENADLVILMVGTNDLLNSKKMISYGEYADNVKLIVMKIKEHGSQLLIMSSPPVDSAYLFMRHDKSLYLQAPNDIMDTASQIVQNVADEQEAVFLDLYRKFCALGVPKHNEDLFFRNQKNSGVGDGVHPTALGYNFIAEEVYQVLMEKKMLRKDIKIVCFGDSITKGAGVDKEVSYPSILFQLINENDLDYATGR